MGLCGPCADPGCLAPATRAPPTPQQRTEMPQMVDAKARMPVYKSGHIRRPKTWQQKQCMEVGKGRSVIGSAQVIEDELSGAGRDSRIKKACKHTLGLMGTGRCQSSRRTQSPIPKKGWTYRWAVVRRLPQGLRLESWNLGGVRAAEQQAHTRLPRPGTTGVGDSS